MLSLAGQLVFDGFAMGLVFVILAVGLVLIASTSRILFMAYGMFYTLGAYTTWFLVNELRLPYIISLPAGVLITGIGGIISYLLIFQRLQNKKGGFLSTLIASMGLQMFLSQAVLLGFGSVPRSIPVVFKGTLILSGIHIGVDKVVLIILSILVTVLFFWIYEKTSFGRSLRAVAFNAEISSLHGINSNLMYMLTIGIGTALAGFAGGVLAPSYGINPAMGGNILWSVMLMTMLGGMDSLLGAVVGGIVIGQMLSFGQYLIGSTIQIIIFLIIGVILYFKPNGLLGRGIDVGI